MSSRPLDTDHTFQRPISCPDCLQPAWLMYCKETPRHATVYCLCPSGIAYQAKETVDVN